jgi:O-succinylbenzoate synthase
VRGLTTPHGGLEGVELVRLRLPLATPWVSAAGVLHARDVVLVRAVVNGVEGWGECVAQPEPTYSPEYVDGAWDVLRRHLVPRLLAAQVTAAEQVAPALAAVKGHQMAKAALELAVLDAQLRAAGVALADHLARRLPGGAERPAPRVPAGVAVGLHTSRDGLVREVEGYVSEGYRRVKLKIRPGWDDEAVAAVREVFGADLAVQVDANGAYGSLADPVGALRPLDRYGLVLIEQPLGDEDLVGHALLARCLATPICLDEAVASLADLDTALAVGACGVLNVKAGRVGGYLAAVDVAARCAAAGVPAWCGGMLETGVGRAANLALAALGPFTLPGDLSAARRFWEADIVTEPAEVDPDGTVAVPAGPGLGVEVRPDAIAGAVSALWLAAT